MIDLKPIEHLLEDYNNMHDAARAILLRALKGEDLDQVAVASATRVLLAVCEAGDTKLLDLDGYQLSKAAVDVLTRAYNGEVFAADTILVAEFVNEHVQSEWDDAYDQAYDEAYPDGEDASAEGEAEEGGTPVPARNAALTSWLGLRP